LRKKSRAGGTKTPDFRLFCRVTVSRHAVTGAKETAMEPRNKCTGTWLINLQQRRQDYTQEEGGDMKQVKVKRYERGLEELSHVEGQEQRR